MKPLKNHFLFFNILLILLFSASCHTAKIHDKPKVNNTYKSNSSKSYSSKNNISDFTKKYSKILDVELTGKEDKKFIEELAKWLGTPYLYGGTTLKGVDCSGFVQTVYKNVYNISLYRTAYDLVKNGELINKKNLKTGDLVFFKINSDKVSHVGIYIKDGKFIHASSSKGVIVSKLSDAYYAKYFYSGGRIKKNK
ncbi:MAG: C40 family peptidase [Bacteroidetes bacterium]|nr:C40 family peptidase [Bacteroidota bacterium]